MIRFQGIRPIIFSSVDTELLTFLPIVLAAILLSWATIRRTPEYAKGRKLNVIAVSVMAVISFGMYLVFGVSVNLLKGILLTDAFLFASVSDFRIRRVPDWVSIVVAALGLISVSGGKLLWNAVAGAVAFGFFFLAAVISKNKIGGADVKFIAAAMFVCGFPEGLAGLILGLLLSVVGTLIRNKKTKSKDKTMPMIPYLSVGFLTAFMIGGI
ncbi:MAG: A24 family peptidase [Clostridia bacterium]|nr:A24 family peptidase [Clostridia bacterium]